MAKIIKVASTTHTPHVANQFKTSRNSATNPFKYSNFEGNTLQFADVFEGFEPKQINKMKMIASSVAGTMHKIKTGITEPIKNFISRVGGGISGAWNYAKNTNISDLGAVKSFNNIMNMEIVIPGSDVISSAISEIKSGVSSKIGAMGESITGFGKSVSDKWSAIVSKMNNSSGIPSGASVSELEEMWKNEISAMEVGGAA